MEEKAESQINKLEEIKKEQVETKKAIIILKEQQKKTNQTLNELKVEQAKTTNSVNELKAELAKTNNSVNITNELLIELLNLKRNKLKNHNQNAITNPKNSSEQVKNINETPRYINILKKPEEKVKKYLLEV